jgi:glycosyltransferase involved in cell wall biosynthesis
MRDAGLIPLHGWKRSHSLPGCLADCALVVATFKRPGDVLALLTAVERLEKQPAEIVIVDGCPAAGLEAQLLDWVEKRRVSFDLIYAESEPGLTRQRNVGIDLSTRRYVCFLDDDAIPLDGYFERFDEIFAADAQHSIGVVGGCVMNEMDKPLSRRWRLRFALGLAPRIEPMIYHRSCTDTPRGLLKPFTGTRRVDVVPGGASAFRREVLDVFRFSEFFQGYSQGEDLEMSLRVGSRWKLVCSGDVRMLHNHSPGGRPRQFQRGKMDVVNRFFIWKRHTPDAEWRYVANFWLDILFLHAMDFAWFCAKPWDASPLRHASGLMLGSLRCLFAPPHFDEPPARPQYKLASVEQPDAQAVSQ